MQLFVFVLMACAPFLHAGTVVTIIDKSETIKNLSADTVNVIAAALPTSFTVTESLSAGVINLSKFSLLCPEYFNKHA